MIRFSNHLMCATVNWVNINSFRRLSPFWHHCYNILPPAFLISWSTLHSNGIHNSYRALHVTKCWNITCSTFTNVWMSFYNIICGQIKMTDCTISLSPKDWDMIQNTFNTLWPRQNGHRFADDTFKCIFLNENVRISIKISLKFVTKGPIYNNQELVQATSHYLNQWWLVYWRIYASLGLNELR